MYSREDEVGLRPLGVKCTERWRALSWGVGGAVNDGLVAVLGVLGGALSVLAAVLRVRRRRRQPGELTVTLRIKRT